MGLDAGTGPGDGLAVRLVDAQGDPIGDALLEVRGDGTERLPTWRSHALPLPAASRGRRVAIELVATDDPDDGDSTVEAAAGSLRVTAP